MTNNLEYEHNNFTQVPNLTVESLIIDRFSPQYWRIDGPQTMSFAITTYGNGFEACFRSRTTTDLAGISWDSYDSKDHKYLAYETKYDYTGVIWDFDIELSASMPVLNNETLTPTLTVQYHDNGEDKVAYIVLFNYTNQPASRSAHIHIDWDSVKAGFSATEHFPVTNIHRIFFSGFTTSYTGSATVPLAQAEDGYIRITNSTITGPNATLTLNRVAVPQHPYGICTSYDDHYDLNPQRLVDNMQALGYHGLINHYCGMSKYPEISWRNDLHKWQIPDALVTGEDVVNPCTRKWHEHFAQALHHADMQPVFGVSFEMYSLGANEFWAQRDWNSNLGRTGYEPPSYFFSLCDQNALAYLHKAFVEFADTMVVGGCEVNMQIGEPWWWYNQGTNLPCVYDFPTKLAFNADTGLYAPDLGTIYDAMNKVGTPYDEFKIWLRNRLGQTCREIRTVLKAKYPDAKICPLIFFPTIRTQIETLASYINYPSEHYSYPNFDYMMTEAYDWLLEARLDLAHQAVAEISTQELNYPADKVAYLSGFVPDSSIAHLYGFDPNKPYRTPIWQRIFGDLKNNDSLGLMKQLIWAYPQVMQDSVTIDMAQAPDGFFMENTLHFPITDNTPYPPEIYL
ncbi:MULTISPECIES: phage capsid protein [unclassified Acinetobacter]|uniref:non-contractile tail sheath protein n=1 Tax=unclassified Acinetobacter TaxID=196816 RepID=UPI002447C4BC|nr:MULTISPECIES: phage capsid protein [unclassified Acinetobacter]MDH0032081.1 phage capsid protein [Acinetobacter sp. GD04021]MDH0887737.1 phage capsid protein [Acinetobacter sp. GD03873]MDH1084085.1 phage capsid protein [Acinetobacter sp. GD03983]MDH2190988.1 phage capsid protein [Acinetobacter sp. GD03645]MDH2204597.1 phage capsid protein [Acinetobacter sp. GD03647]